MDIDDDEFDPNSPELKARYQKTMLATEATESVIDMLYPHYQDAFFVLGTLVGSTLFKYIHPEEMESMLSRICDHAKATYQESEEAEKKEKKFAKEYLKH
jgi:hypothetical protein